MPYFNVPNTTGTFPELLTYVNHGMYPAGHSGAGIFGMFMLLAIFLIGFISMKDYATEKAFTASAFITAVASYMLAILGIVGGEMIVTTTVILLVSVFFLHRSGN